MAMAVETRMSHIVARVTVAPKSLSCQVCNTCHRHHQSQTTRVWNVLDGTAQVRFRVLDCTLQGVGFGVLGLIVWHEEVLSFGF